MRMFWWAFSTTCQDGEDGWKSLFLHMKWSDINVILCWCVPDIYILSCLEFFLPIHYMRMAYTTTVERCSRTRCFITARLSFSYENGNVSGDVFNEKLEEQSRVYVLYWWGTILFFFDNEKGIRFGVWLEVTKPKFFLSTCEHLGNYRPRRVTRLDQLLRAMHCSWIMCNSHNRNSPADSETQPQRFIT